MQRFRIDIIVNGKKVPNTIVFDEKSALHLGSEDYRKELVQMLLSTEQNIGSLEWAVTPLEEESASPEEAAPAAENKPIDPSTLALFQ